MNALHRVPAWWLVGGLGFFGLYLLVTGTVAMGVLLLLVGALGAALLVIARATDE